VEKLFRRPEPEMSVSLRRGSGGFPINHVLLSDAVKKTKREPHEPPGLFHRLYFLYFRVMI